MTTTTITRYRISISRDGIWAGSGKYHRYTPAAGAEYGEITDCDAVLSDRDNEYESEAAYEAITEALADMMHLMDGQITCDGHVYAWTLQRYYQPEIIPAYVATLSDEVREDIAADRWDEVMTDALYHACGARTPDDMMQARGIAGWHASEALTPA